MIAATNIIFAVSFELSKDYEVVDSRGCVSFLPLSLATCRDNGLDFPANMPELISKEHKNASNEIDEEVIS